ncbi:MAG: ABC transporter substrate-binding protein [Sterolibacterium sp.]|nr:ABC transporter substrate-binding protein [Sterolibacterium sp.]
MSHSTFCRQPACLPNATLTLRAWCGLHGIRKTLLTLVMALLTGALCGISTTALAVGADPAKVLRLYFPAAEDGFDPAAFASLYSNIVSEAIFERLLTYDYLARPARLAPMAAQELPTISADGLTYTFQLRRGIYFTPDPAFRGQPRELVAEDFIYSFKRFMDPALRSPWQFILEDKIVGLDELAAAARQSGRFDYDRPIAGLSAPDRYTLRIQLKTADPNFSYIMAHTPFGALAREVVETYGKEIIAHPVGTGAYQLKEWKRRNRIVLTANPGYRGFIWQFQPSADEYAKDQALIQHMQGKSMPQIGRVEISIIEEPQSVWLAFKSGQLDVVNVPQQFIGEALQNNQLSPAFRQQGVQLQRATDPEITYTFFNMQDPVVGGFSKEKIALRRAIAMAYDLNEEIRVIRQGQAVRAQMPIPAGVVGHDPTYRSSLPFDPALANALLDRYGYRRGADGWRSLPDGSALSLHLQGVASGAARPFDELWKKSLDRIGIRAEFPKSNFADNLKAAKSCKIQMMGSAWTADYPDGDNFMQNFYGPNLGQSNNGCYQSPAFDALYQAAQKLPDGEPRNELFRHMSRQLEADTAIILHLTRQRTQLIRPWLLGYKKHPILHAEWMYLDIEAQP